MLHYQNKKTFTTIWVSSLTFLAGAINVSAIFLLDRTISHQTGSLSRISIALIEQDYQIAFDLFTYVALFFIGAFVSGYSTYQRNRAVRILHSIYPFIFGILLILGDLNTISSVDLLRVMAFGMGLQNGTYIRFHNIIIRTTHMSGYVTDAAVSLGRAFRGNKEERFKALYLIYSIFCFVCGGLFASLLYAFRSPYHFLILGLMYCLVAILVFSFHPKRI